MFNHDLFNKILNTITDGIYITDKEANTLWINEASARNLGRSRSELIGKNSMLLAVEGVVSPSVVRMVIESGDPVSTVQSIDTGRKYLVTGHPIYDEHGQVQIIVIHSRDITQAVQLTNQLEDMEALLTRYTEEIRLLTLERNLGKIKESYVGHSKSYTTILDLIEQISQVDTNVLITGETGVGKNIIAQRIHQLSPRAKHPFIEVNCGAIPESLLESELFGYKKGAFTGANSSGKTGLIEMASKGTLLLDEIGELPLQLQSKLLHFLQNKTYRSVGDTAAKKADVRVLSATNGDLMEMVAAGKFRSDLYYRLNIIPIEIPPLRERREDILPLIQHFLHDFHAKYHSKVSLSGEVIDHLVNYHWPGNIRELENLIERLVVTAKSGVVEVEDLPKYIQPQNPASPRYELGMESLPKHLERVEREIIEQAHQTYQTTRKTAEVLGVTQSYLMRRLQKYTSK
jgi:PAS domain S-box-containing protein